MKHIKSIIRFAALLLLMVCAQTVKAQQTYIMVHKVDGTVLRIAVADVDSVTFREWTGPIFSYEYVDLGLSVKWATCNVGAQSPEQTGGYFAWGETEEKDGCYYDNYKFTDSDGYYTKYNLWQSAGKVDMKYRLDPEDDAAAKLLGDGWRTPTREEFQELLDNCNWNPAVMNGVKGYRVVSKMNNNSIFIPLTGESWQGDTLGYNRYAYYYSNTLSIDRANSASNIYSAYMYQNSDDNYGWYMAYFNRVGGLPIRPVYSSTWVDNVVEVKGVSIEEDNLTIEVGQSSYLSGYVILKDGEMNPEWKTSDALIARVESNGVVFGVTEGQCMIYASYDNYSDSCLVTVIGFEQEMEYVDMGLSVHWATCNIGASSPERVGQYYAWGETEVKAEYDWSTYKYGDSEGYMTKYCPNPAFGVNGYSDSLTVLEPDDDVAQVLWGDDWRMPTYEEITELIENCDFQWIEQGDVIGYYVTSRVEGYEKSSIFIPYSEDMSAVCFWSSSVAFRQSNYASLLVDNTNRYIYARCNGLPIRPVCPNENYVKPTLTLSYQEMTVIVGNNSQISPIIGNSWISPTEVTWLSSDTTVATIDIYGQITAKAEGTCTITAIYKDQSADCFVTVIEASKPQYVDLGLSVKWATFNVGATAPFEIGDYYAWGAIDTTSNYSWESYRFFTGYNDDEEAQVSKYVTNSYYGENVDNLTVLESADDVAFVKWGGNWRTPTRDEFEELVDLCEWEWTEYNGVYGYLVTSRVTGYMDRSIFLPEYCWSSSLYTSNPLGAYALAGQKIGAYYRRVGLAIRPVYTFDVSEIEGLLLDKSVVSLALGSEVVVNATPYNADGRAITVNGALNITWTSGDADVATVTDGKIKAVGVGKCVITATYDGETYEVSVTVEDPSQVTPESVDLGLSVKWATFNLGAFQPEMTGDYYAWGELEPYYAAGYAQSTTPIWKEGKDAGYNWASYFDTDDTGQSFKKYSAESGRKVLDIADDAANQAWGGKWRIPTSAEYQELIDNCSWSYEEVNGVTGFRITSKEKGYQENSIFMPITGYRTRTALYDDESNNEGYYWTSSIDVAASSVSVMCLTDMDMFNVGRIYGFLYRPVEMYDDSEIQGLIISETKYELGIGNKLALTVQGDLDGHAISLSGTAVWSSSDDSVATVVDGVVKAVGAGVATITASYNGQEVYCSITVFDQYDVETEYVDLGLSVNWATFNLGANKPEMKGDYFAWGETSPKSVYTQDTYKFNSDSLRKYGDDGKYILDSEDDAAQVLWGGSWRMPTADEFQELIDNCSWTLTELDGVNGYLVTSKITGYTDKSIFLPITGSIRGNTEYNDEGYYWASTMNPDDETSIADYLYLDNQLYSVWRYYRYQGRSIRPVCPNSEYVDKVVLTDDATVLVNETVDGEPVYKAAPRIVADPADSTNNCIIVTAPSYPENYYDAQLYITVSDSVELTAGAILELSFRYKADNSVDCATEIHSVPGEWAGEGPGYIYFSPRWQKYSISTPVMDPDQRVFVINLAYLEEGNNFYFDDIAVTIVDNMADGFILNTNILIRTVGEYGYLYAHDNAGNELNQFTQWVSTNDSVAVVNSFGEVRAIGEGTCYILASYRDYKDSCEVTVIANNDDPYLELSYHQVDTRVGHTLWLNYYTNIHDGVYWSSTDDSVAVVDKEGYITALGVGSCFIVVSTGKLSDSCLVVVRNNEYADSLVSHDFVVKDDSVFFYCYNSYVGYEMLATFAETDTTDYMVCTGLYASVAYKTAEEAQQAYADMTSEMSEEQIQSYNFRLIDDEGIYGITYNYPTVIGMAKENVITMMRQWYEDMIDDTPDQSEYHEAQEG